MRAVFLVLVARAALAGCGLEPPVSLTHPLSLSLTPVDPLNRNPTMLFALCSGPS